MNKFPNKIQIQISSGKNLISLLQRAIYVYFLVIFTIFLFVSCDKKVIIEEEPMPEPCSQLVIGVYKYPTEKPDSSLTNAEIKEYWDIPEDVLGCISTAGLIQSCYETHNAIIIMAKDGYQSGYELVKGWNRGFDELESREDGATEFIQFYKNIELSERIDYGLCCLEVAMAQDSMLKRLSLGQKVELLNITLDYYPLKKEKYTHNAVIYEGTPIIMGRLMLFDNYTPFVQAVERNEEIYKFIDGIYRAQISFANADTIVMYTEKYLEELSGN